MHATDVKYNNDYYNKELCCHIVGGGLINITEDEFEKVFNSAIGLAYNQYVTEIKKYKIFIDSFNNYDYSIENNKVNIEYYVISCKYDS